MLDERKSQPGAERSAAAMAGFAAGDPLSVTPPRPAAESAPTHEIGVLFVHGIGQQSRGATLLDWGEPMAVWIQQWIDGLCTDIKDNDLHAWLSSHSEGSKVGNGVAMQNMTLRASSLPIPNCTF